MSANYEEDVRDVDAINVYEDNDEGREAFEGPNADIVASHANNTRYGLKVALDSPYEAKDDIKSLDWDRFHPDWDGDFWTIDADALWGAIKELTMDGYTVAVPETMPTTENPVDDGIYLPEGGE